MVSLVGRQPFGQQSRQARTARLERGKPDRLEHRQELLRIILPRTAQPQDGRAGRRWLRAQGADGGLAVIAQQGDGLVEQLAFVAPAGAGILPTQFDQHFVFGFLAHVVVHVG